MSIVNSISYIMLLSWFYYIYNANVEPRSSEYIQHLYALLPEFPRNICLHNHHLFHFLHPVLLILQHIVLSEMLDIFRMDQVFLCDIVPTVKLFEMMYFILVLVVAMVAGAESEVREFAPRSVEAHELIACDDAGALEVEDLEYLGRDFGFAGFRNGRGRFVVQAIEAANRGGGPDACIIKIVEGEEGGGIEVVDVVFLSHV